MIGTVMILVACLADQPAVCEKVSDRKVYPGPYACLAAGVTASPDFLEKHPQYGRIARIDCASSNDVEKTLDRLLDQPA